MKKVTLEQNLINEIQSAIENEQFLVYLYLNIIWKQRSHMGQRRLFAGNTLIKVLCHPEFLFLFLKETDIAQIDLYMWERVCKLFLRKWIDEGKDPSPILRKCFACKYVQSNLVIIFTSLVKKYDI